VGAGVASVMSMVTSGDPSPILELQLTTWNVVAVLGFGCKTACLEL
jgi:hypothetical protein